MGRSESAAASIGYRVSIRDLLESIHDEKSCTYAYDTLTNYDVFIEDDNNEENHAFLTLTEQLENKDVWESTKECWLHHFRKLLDHDLLIPIRQLVDTTRWGYNREGTNGTGCLVQCNFSEELNRLYDTCPPHHRVVWIIRQSGG